MLNILFKAKRADSLEWVKGFYVCAPAVADKDEKHYIQLITKDGNIGALVEVLPETVGQYTTLDDDIGVEIFVGDKLRAIIREGTYEGYSPGIFEVIFEKGEYCLKNFGNVLPLDTEDDYIKFRVVGNAHDGKGGSTDEKN